MEREPTEQEVEAGLKKVSDAQFIEMNLVNIREQAQEHPHLTAVVRRFEKIRDRLQRLDGSS